MARGFLWKINDLLFVHCLGLTELSVKTNEEVEVISTLKGERSIQYTVFIQNRTGLHVSSTGEQQRQRVSEPVEGCALNSHIKIRRNRGCLSLTLATVAKCQREDISSLL